MERQVCHLAPHLSRVYQPWLHVVGSFIQIFNQIELNFLPDSVSWFGFSQKVEGKNWWDDICMSWMVTHQQTISTELSTPAKALSKFNTNTNLLLEMHWPNSHNEGPPAFGSALGFFQRSSFSWPLLHLVCSTDRVVFPLYEASLDVIYPCTTQVSNFGLWCNFIWPGRENTNSQKELARLQKSHNILFWCFNQKKTIIKVFFFFLLLQCFIVVPVLFSCIISPWKRVSVEI